MGHGIGKALVERGFDVITCLVDRSQRTRDLAERAGLRDVPSLEDMVVQADLIMSILVPAQAVSVAKEVADAMRTAAAPRPYADCNAVSPGSAVAIASIIGAAEGDYIDAGIIGGSPARGAVPRLYTSGPRASLMDELNGKSILVRNLGPGVASASGLKMCYAAMTKGTNALRVAMLTAAETLGLYDDLIAELAESQGEALAAMESGIPALPANAGRWIGEMEEIAATFEAAGVTPGFHQGAAEVFRLLDSTPFATETPESIDHTRTLKETIQATAERLQERPVIPAC